MIAEKPVLVLERMRRGMTQGEFSRQTGVAQSILSGIERRRYVPGEKHRAAIMEALGMRTEDIFDERTGLAR